MPPIYAVATDAFMSGWGLAQRRSIVAIECHTREELDFALTKLEGRAEMKRVRTCQRLPRLANGDHLAIYTRAENPVWFPKNN